MSKRTRTVRACLIPEDGGPQTTEQAVLALLHDWSARDMAMAGLDIPTWVLWNQFGWWDPLMDLALTLAYVEADPVEHSEPDGGTPVDEERLATFVAKWHTALVDMTTGHSHDVFTAAEHSADDLLGPVLTMPIAQMREFASRLSDALEQDRRVPFLVWSSFKRVVAPLILARPEGDVLRLKTALAQEVAELVEHRIPREDLVAAIAGALQWRGLEQLTQVKAAVEQGAVPHVRGRQSCLFLEATAPEDADRVLATVIL